jgi:hypothetical protein
MPVKSDETPGEPKIAPVYAKASHQGPLPPAAGSKPAAQPVATPAASAPAPSAAAVSSAQAAAPAISAPKQSAQASDPKPTQTYPQPAQALAQASQLRQAPPAESAAKLAPLANSEAAVEILNNIDTALSACATNLAALQRLAGEQTEVLKTLSNTLQNQTLFEIGLNLNSLTESLSAALEPMKAIGELVPAMDQLVSALDGRAPLSTGAAEALPAEQLVTNLADQLSAGLIDPWTFRCAYMAIFPTEHPADLLHRLVQLLGSQRLSGDLFRAAYEAVQSTEAAGAVAPSAPSTGGGGAASAHIRQQIEQLQKANDELRGRQEQRERELQDILQEKDAELQEVQGMLNSRYDEFNSRYEEVADALSKREDEYRTLLESKDMELVEKESELNILRTQMEELKNQTEDMVKDLQRQLLDMKRQEPAKQQPSSFFDNPPAPMRNMGNDPQASSGAMPTFPAQQQQMQQQMQQPVQQPMQQQMQQQMPPQPAQQIVQQPMMAPQASQPVHSPPPGQSPRRENLEPHPSTPQQPAATTPFSSGPGSYGSGVRAQVFEVIVRQALAGAPWREICSGPMQVNNISPDEVEAEVKRRQALLNK